MRKNHCVNCRRRRKSISQRSLPFIPICQPDQEPEQDPLCNLTGILGENSDAIRQIMREGIGKAII